MCEQQQALTSFVYVLLDTSHLYPCPVAAIVGVSDMRLYTCLPGPAGRPAFARQSIHGKREVWLALSYDDGLQRKEY